LLKAQIIKTKLESMSIPVLLDYESVAPVLGITVYALGSVYILVPDKYAEEAQALIEEHDCREDEDLDASIWGEWSSTNC
jgi:hypothetical protein